MKLLSPKVIKAVLILLSIGNLALCSFIFIESNSLAQTILAFTVVQLILLLIYMTYVANVVWVNESIQDIKFRVNRNHQNQNENFKNNIKAINNINANLSSQIKDVLNHSVALNKVLLNAERKILGLENVLYNISIENEIFRSKLLKITEQNEEHQLEIREFKINSESQMENIGLSIEKSKSEIIDLINQFDGNINDLIKQVDENINGLINQLDRNLEYLISESKEIRIELSQNSVNIKENLNTQLKENTKETSQGITRIIQLIDNTEKILAEYKNTSLSKIDGIYNYQQKNGIATDNTLTQLKNSTYYNYNRIDALFSIHQIIKLRSPLPIMHDWAISSDYAHYLLKTILNKGEGNVIDIGSGISTILLGYAVEKNGKGKVISLEHDKEYFGKTLELIKDHGLEKYVELYYCPLISVEISGQPWLWYDISKVQIPENIVLISVDGPPGNTQKLARYPAVPQLKFTIKSGTTILLDDAKRSEEDEIAAKWEREFLLSKEFIDGYKGIYKFEK